MDTTVEGIIKWHVYQPHGWVSPFSKTRCAQSIPEGGRSVSFRQCLLKPTITIHGYGFCKRHARELQAELDKLKEHDT